MKYSVKIQEILETVIEVEAFSKNEAESKAKNSYWDKDVVLSSEKNCVGYSVRCLENEPEIAGHQSLFEEENNENKI